MYYKFLILDSSIADYITAFSAMGAVIVAIYGFNEWKRQLKGKTDYETARRYLKSALKLRDAMKYVRNPFIPIAEMEKAFKENGIEDGNYGSNEKTNRAVYSVRWKKVTEAATDLEAELLEAEVSWGRDAIKAQDDLDSLVRELRVIVTLFLNGTPREGEEHLIYDTGENDPFSKKINTAIEKIENYLKPYLK